jgi:hypothetical protein
MPNFADIYGSPRSQCFGSIASANAIKTSIATDNAAAHDYTGVALNGAVGAGAIDFPKTISVTTSVHAASYKTGALFPIVVTGTDKDANVISESLLLTQTNGGETISGDLGFATVTNIHVPAQNDALGAFTFGVRDIVYPFRSVRGGGAATTTVKVGYEGGHTDKLVMAYAGQLEPVLPQRIYDDGNTTSWPVTVYV